MASNTEREPREDALRTSGGFLASVSHELRTPLNGVLGVAELLLSTPLTPEQREYAEVIRSSGETLLSIVNDALDFSPAEARHVAIDSVDIHVDDLVETVDLAKYRALLVVPDEENRRRVARHLATTGIHVDESHTAADAIVAAHQRNYDVIAFDMYLPDEDGLSFARSIRDDPALDRTRLLLLTAFGRRRDDVAAYESAGIDAFLTKPIRRARLCDALSRLLLAKTSRPHVRDVDVPPQPSRARVLIVEDNSVNQLVALGQLQRLGHEAVLVSSGREALDALREGVFDIVLMDCQMPDIDGYETTRRIRQIEGPASKTPIVAITAHSISGEREKCLAAGMNDYLPKPVSVEQLGAVIRLWASKAIALRQRAPSSRIR